MGNGPRTGFPLIKTSQRSARACLYAPSRLGRLGLSEIARAVPVPEQPEQGPRGMVAERSPASYFFSRDASMAPDGSGVALGPPKMHDIRIKHLLLTLRDASYRQLEPIVW